MATSTVVVAREDLSIPGALEPDNAGINSPEQVENQFFNLLDQHKADAVVLDLMGSQGHGVAAIRRIRRGSAVPIVVLCPAEDKRMAAYRRAGALTCMSPPIDLIQLKETVLPSTRPAATAVGEPDAVSFAGLVLHPRDKRLTGPRGREVTLSEVEAGVLLHLAGTPGVIWPAQAIIDSLDGARPGDADRAVPAIIAKLRKKLGSLGGPAAQRLIKTEIGRGYVFAAEAALTEAAAFSVRSG
jgi:two-component system phosphate regulon response regulator OmpR